MPYIGVTTSREIPQDKRGVILKALSSAIATSTGKPEQYVMITISPANIMFAGEINNAAFVDIRGIGGLNVNVNRDLTKRICALLEAFLAIPPNSVYLTFTDVEATNWGWNGTTFG